MIKLFIELLFDKTIFQIIRCISESMTHVKYMVKSTESDESGQYIIVASNKYGSSNSCFHVEIKTIPLIVSIPESEYIGTEKQSQFEIPCSILSVLKKAPRINWFFDGAKIATAGNVYKVRIF